MVGNVLLSSVKSWGQAFGGFSALQWRNAPLLDIGTVFRDDVWNVLRRMYG